MSSHWDCARECCLCRRDAAYLGKLLGPIGEDKTTGEALFVHRLCAIWSPEVYQTDEGTIKNISATLKRGRAILCAHCGKRGATIGCVLERCQCSFHLSCAKEAGCHFLPMKYLLSCADHAAMLLESAKSVTGEESLEALGPQTTQPFLVPTWSSARGNARASQDGPSDMSAMKLMDSGTPQVVPNLADAELFEGEDNPEAGARKKRSPPWKQKGVKAQCKRARNTLKAFKISQRLAAQNHGHDSDEEKFAQQERARYVRDRQAVKLSEELTARATKQMNEGFTAVGGLQPVVHQLKEMVLLPLAYPELFRHMGIQPPRGILLHGAPGCGKTLLARSLAVECQKVVDPPVAFFSRKGADCLGEFAGDAERILRLLFEEAQSQAPSIIFLDELDALVPCRSTREGGADQTYASVVTTILALMDGLTDRGNVVIVGATNRPEGIDPALRRPGRFDREVYVGLPTVADRAAILAAQTKKWEPAPSKRLLHAVAEAAEGFGGADLAALCTGAVLEALHRTAPNLMDVLDHQEGSGKEEQDCVAVDEKTQKKIRSYLPSIQVNRLDWISALSKSAPPCSARQGLASLNNALCRPVDYHASPLLLPTLERILGAIQTAGMGSSGTLLDACEEAAAACGPSMQDNWRGLEQVLISQGAVSPRTYLLQEPELACLRGSKKASGGSKPGSRSKLQEHQASTCCRILVCGDQDQGQQACCAAVLRLASPTFVVVALPQMLDAGAGSAAAGVVTLIKEAVLQSTSTTSPLVVYMPRIEDWAICDGELAHPVITSTWNICEASLSDHVMKREVIVLASCHRSMDRLPEALVQFFSRGGAVSSHGAGVISTAHGFRVPSLIGDFVSRVVNQAAFSAAAEAEAVLSERRNMDTSLSKTSLDCGQDGSLPLQAPASLPQHADSNGIATSGTSHLSDAVLDAGRRTYIQLQAHLAALGQRLLKDRRSKMAAQMSQHVAGHVRHGGPRRPSSFYELGKMLSRGQIRTLHDLLQTVSVLNNSIQEAAEKQGLLYVSSCGASAALEDEICLWIDSITTQLKLNNRDVKAACSEAHKEDVKRQQMPATSHHEPSAPALDLPMPKHSSEISDPMVTEMGTECLQSHDTGAHAAASRGSSPGAQRLQTYQISKGTAQTVDEVQAKAQEHETVELKNWTAGLASRLRAGLEAPAKSCLYLSDGSHTLREEVLPAAGDFITLANTCARQCLESFKLPDTVEELPEVEAISQAIIQQSKGQLEAHKLA